MTDLGRGHRRRTNPWLARRPLVYAHQGGAREAPSSTVYAFRRAVGLGTHGLEMDVHRTIDGHLVVSHDETVDRTSNGSGRISELTLAELRALDNAYWFVPGHDVVVDLAPSDYPLRGAFPADDSVGFALLDDVLRAFPRTYLNFDIKETEPEVVPYEGQLADALRAYGRSTDVIVASFHDEALARFRSVAPEISTSLGPDDVLAVGLAIEDQGPEPTLHPSVVALQIPTHFGETEIVTRHFVDGAHERGLAVHVWTIDEAQEMRRLFSLGVDAIITDCPSVALAVVGS